MINKTYRELFCQENTIRQKLNLFFCQPECYQVDSIEDLLRNQWRIIVPPYKILPKIGSEKNAKGYEKIMFETTRNILKQAVLISTNTPIYAINSLSEETPWLYNLEIRDGKKGRIEASFFDEEKFIACIEEKVFNLESEYSKKDALLNSILERLHNAKNDDEETQIFNSLSENEKKHFYHMGDIMIFDATKTYQKILQEQQILPLLDPSIDKMRKEKEKTNIYFEKGIILGYCPKTKKFSLIDLL
jgi:hypothetical protein